MMWAENYETDSESCFSCESSATIEYNADGTQTIKYYSGKNGIVRKEAKVTNENLSNQENKMIAISDNCREAYAFDNFSRIWANPYHNILGWTRLEHVNPLKFSLINLSGYEIESSSRSEGSRFNFSRYSSSFPSHGDYPKEMAAIGYSTRAQDYKVEFFYNKNVEKPKREVVE